MESCEQKTKEELVKLVVTLERKLEEVSSELTLYKKRNFCDKYGSHILDAFSDMLTVIDHDGTIVELISSPETNHVEGTTVQNLINANVEDLLPESAYRSLRQNMDKVIATGRKSIAGHSMMFRGELRHYENQIFPLDEKYLFCICHDVTNQRKVEQELISARLKAEESDRLKSAFLANMSHEIRTPLNSIVGFSRLAIEAKEETVKKQYVEIVEKNSDILLNLFNDILDLSALEAGVLQFAVEPVSLISVCEMLLWEHRCTLRKDVNLILDAVDRELIVYGDKHRISQVLDNLLSNACKFTPQGTVRFGFESKNNVIQFYVQDTGIGVSPEKASTIFQRFGKVDDFVQGTGLGLTICRLLVEKMGGRIWVRSKLGHGTTFYFTLPQQI